MKLLKVKNLWLLRLNQIWLWLGAWVILSSSYFVQPVQADENFLIDLHTDYEVSLNGETKVNHNFTIINKTPSFFINRYSILVSSINPTNISAKMADTALEPVVTSKENQTTISVEFPEKVVGENKALNFNIQYSTQDLAQISGKVLEVSIPPMTKTETFRNFSVNVSTPDVFGLPSRTTPDMFSSANKSGIQTVAYDKKASKGIISVYGAEQFFKLNLSYKLNNPGNQPVLTQITFPPDTNTQQVVYEEIVPRPDSWKTDLDGNWLASYSLPANNNLVVTAIAKVKLLLEPPANFSIQPILPEYTQAEDFWPITNPIIQTAAKTAKTPKEIYDFTLENLSYTTAILTKDLVRLGAVKALLEPTLTTCQEYADVFISLARANNIPARRLVGYAQTKNQQLRPTGFQGDVLHAWAEYYDPNQKIWKVVDPTWGDTTGGIDYFNQMDLNHIVFAINGTSSSLPFPAGSYQEGQEPTKSIEVNFSENFPESAADPSIELKPKKILGFNIPGWSELILINPAGQAWYNLNFEFPEALKVESSLPLPTKLLPYQVIKTTVSAYNEALPDHFNLFDFKFKLKLNQRIIGGGQQNLYVIPKFISQLGFSKFLLAMAAGLVICAGLTGSLFILGYKWANSLRRQSQKPAAPPSKLYPLPPAQPQDQENGSDSPGGEI